MSLSSEGRVCVSMLDTYEMHKGVCVVQATVLNLCSHAGTFTPIMISPVWMGGNGVDGDACCLGSLDSLWKPG